MATGAARVDVQAAAIFADVEPGTIHKWVKRGKIRRHADGYDLGEIEQWIGQRDTGRARGALLGAHSKHQQASARDRGDA